MFRFEELERIHIEISSNCQASCPMCPRNYHGGLTNPDLLIKDWSLNDFKHIFNKELLFQIKGFYFCGNYGDPILNDNLINMVEYSKNVNPNVGIRIHTNGGARSEEWWKKLAKALPYKHNVHFAIDGLEDTLHLYRIGVTYDKLLKNAKSFIDAGGKATWSFIRFKHNEHQVEIARDRAKELGFENFVLKNTTRFTGGENKFEVYDKNGNVTHYLEAPTGNDLYKNDKKILDNSNLFKQTIKINCMVLEQKEIYIDCFKRVYPCCFLALPTMRKPPKNNNTEFQLLCNQYDEYISKIFETNDASVKTIKSILNGNRWQSIDWYNEYWGENKMFICSRTCGKTEIIPEKDNHSDFIKTVVDLKSI